MTHAEFEQLVCAWLDEPQRTDLRQQVEAAIGADPSLAAHLDEWRRFDRCLRAALPPPGGVRWEALRLRFSQAVDEAVQREEFALDAALKHLPTVEHRVNWPRLHQRIASAVRRSAGRRAGLRAGLGVLSLVGLAAAAALVLSVLPDAAPSAVSSGLVQVSVRTPALAPSSGTVVVRVSVPEGCEPEPERFFCIDPVRRGAIADEVAGYY